MCEPRRFDILPIPFGRIRAEVYRSQGAAPAIRPAAVVPGAHYEVVDVVRIALFIFFVSFNRAVMILGIEPATHVESRNRDRCLNIWKHAAIIHLPVPIQVRVFIEGVPTRRLAMEDCLVDVR